MKQSLTTLLLVCLVGSPAFAGAPDYFTEKEKDFGVTALGSVHKHFFAIKNTTKEVINMGTPRIQCGCVAVELIKGQLQPGETTYLMAVMSTAKIPSHQIGLPKSVTVSVPFHNPVFEEVVLKVSVLARPDMIWSVVEGVTFGKVAKGKEATNTLKVTLYNSSAWEIEGIESSGVYVKSEAKLISRTPTEVNYEIVTTLKDNCPPGNWMSELTVKSKNAPGIEKMRVPVTVNVISALSVSPESVKLGALPTGDSKTIDVTINGLQPFKVLEVKSGDDNVSVKPITDGARIQHMLKVDVKGNDNLTRDVQILTDSKEMPTVVLPVTYTVKK
jgi:hypothetical protein